MSGLRRFIFFLLLGGLAAAQTATAQKQEATTKSSKNDLEMITIGEGRMLTGPHCGFRIYKAHDGTDGEVWYSGFLSMQQAELEIKDRLKPANEVTHESRKDDTGQIIRERIVAVLHKPHSTEKTFLIIRRNRLWCWFIYSASLPTAIQVEKLIHGSN